MSLTPVTTSASGVDRSSPPPVVSPTKSFSSEASATFSDHSTADTAAAAAAVTTASSSRPEMQAYEDDAARLGILTISKSPVSSETLSQLFYEASNTWNRDSYEQLKAYAEQGLLLAQGFLMRMYSFGSGLAKNDAAEAAAIAKVVVPILVA
eukprot:gene17618-22270_t